MILSRCRTINLLDLVLTEREGVVAPRAEGLGTSPTGPLRQGKGPGRPRHATTASREMSIPRMNKPRRMVDALGLEAVACARRRGPEASTRVDASDLKTRRRPVLFFSLWGAIRAITQTPRRAASYHVRIPHVRVVHLVQRAVVVVVDAVDREFRHRRAVARLPAHGFIFIAVQDVAGFCT